MKKNAWDGQAQRDDEKFDNRREEKKREDAANEAVNMVRDGLTDMIVDAEDDRFAGLWICKTTGEMFITMRDGRQVMVTVSKV